jgi:hypothetical protein
MGVGLANVLRTLTMSALSKISEMLSQLTISSNLKLRSKIEFLEQLGADGKASSSLDLIQSTIHSNISLLSPYLILEYLPSRVIDVVPILIHSRATVDALLLSISIGILHMGHGVD